METYNHPRGYHYGVGGVSLFRMPVEPATTYTVSYYVKTDRPDKVFARPGTHEYDDQGVHLGQHYTYIPLEPGWQRVEWTFTTFDTSVAADVGIPIHGNFEQAVDGWKEGVFYTSWIDAIQIEQATAATPFHVTLAGCADALPATLDLDPNTLNLKSRGKPVTGYIELPDGFAVGDIQVDSVAIIRVEAMATEPLILAEGPVSIGDHDQDGIADLMVKFSRPQLIQALGETTGDVPVTVAGELAGGVRFAGSDTIRVIQPGQ